MHHRRLDRNSERPPAIWGLTDFTLGTFLQSFNFKIL
jgi:hypothetical protein